jgi:uncharacterized protein with HEPN domain
VKKAVKDEELYLTYIQEAIEAIERFTVEGREAFMASDLIQSAVIYKLQTLAESTT